VPGNPDVNGFGLGNELREDISLRTEHREIGHGVFANERQSHTPQFARELSVEASLRPRAPVGKRPA
jgi:hypothetical protein